MIYALLSWYDEKPEHLERCITSLQGIADHVIALDGPYATFPGATRNSPLAQHHAILDAAQWSGMGCTIDTLSYASEVAKRARLFNMAREQGANASDWLLIIDADTHVHQVGGIPVCAPTRYALDGTHLDVADVTMHNVKPDGSVIDTMTVRSLYRALPGITVERTHWLYTLPGEPRRYLWHTPDGNISTEPALNLTAHMLLLHRRSERDETRNDQARRYYEDRDARHLEAAGDWI